VRSQLFSNYSRNSPNLWNAKVDYGIHQYPPSLSILSQLNQPHSSTLQFLKFRLNIVLPSISLFLQWSPSLKIPHQNHLHTSPIHHTHFMPSPSHSRFRHLHNNMWPTKYETDIYIDIYIYIYILLGE
jgi:hypothetical protein